MPKRIRFSLNRFAEPTLPDGSAQVRYGVMEGETLFETRTPWSEEKGAAYRLSDVRLLPPCCPSKIVGVGRNYREHASELGNPLRPFERGPAAGRLGQWDVAAGLALREVN